MNLAGDLLALFAMAILLAFLMPGEKGVKNYSVINYDDTQV